MRAAQQVGAPRNERGDTSVSSLLGGIVTDVQTLVRKEIALQSREIQQRIDGAAVSMGQLVAVGCLAVLGAGLVAVGLALAVAQAAGWPAWGGLLAVGGVLAVAGVIGLALYQRAHRRDGQEWHGIRTSSGTR